MVQQDFFILQSCLYVLGDNKLSMMGAMSGQLTEKSYKSPGFRGCGVPRIASIFAGSEKENTHK